MDVLYKKLMLTAQEPYRATSGSAGYDLCATSKEWDEDTQCWKYGTGLAFDIPAGCVGLVFPRSSVYKYGLTMANCVGVIDSDYRGEVSACFRGTKDSKTYAIGDRCCQLVVIKCPEIDWVECDSLTPTKRGVKGYGSTGV